MIVIQISTLVSLVLLVILVEQMEIMGYSVMEWKYVMVPEIVDPQGIPAMEIRNVMKIPRAVKLLHLVEEVLVVGQ